MPDLLAVSLDPTSTSVKPGQQAQVGVTIQNTTDDTEQYELALEGPEEVRGWAEIQISGTVLQAFPTEFASATVQLRPPSGWPGKTYNLRVRARSRSRKSTDGFADFDVIVVAPVPPPIPLGTGRGTAVLGDDRGTAVLGDDRGTAVLGDDRGVILITSPTIEVEADEVSNASLPSTAGQWNLQLHNAGSRITTFGFGVFGLTPRMISVEPAEVPLRPGERATALLTVRLAAETSQRSYPFYLRTYSFLNLDERTEIALDLVVRPPAEPSPGPPVAPNWLKVKVDEDSFAVDPGITKRVSLTLQNLRGQAVAPELRVAGAPARWYSLGVTSVNLPARQIASVDVAITVPDVVPPGAYPLSIRGEASQGALASFQVDLLVEVLKTTGGPIRISVDPKRLNVRPGDPVDARVTVLNRMKDPASVQLDLPGIDRSWVQVSPISPIDGGQQASVVVRIRPPSDLTLAEAGIYSIPIQAISRQASGEPGEADAELTVELVGDYQVDLEPAEPPTARGVTQALRVRNQSNAPVSLRFAASDLTGTLLYTFTPTECFVPPGSEAKGVLTVRAREIVSVARSVDFKVMVTGEHILHGGADQPASGRELAGRFVQQAASPVSVGITSRQATGVDRGEYRVRVSNPGATLALVALAAADTEGALDFAFSPNELKLAPGEEGVATLVASTKEKPKSGDRKEYSFSVTATPDLEGDVFPSTSKVTLVTQEKPGCLALAPPIFLIGLLSGLAGLVGLKGWWKLLIAIPAVIAATAVAFLMTGGETGFALPMLPAPIGGLLRLGPHPAPAITQATTTVPATTTAPATPTLTPSIATPVPPLLTATPSRPATPVPPTVAPPIAKPSPTSNPTSSQTSSSDAQAQANALVTSKMYSVADPSTYGAAGPLHVLIGAATGGDGHSQLAYIFYDSTYLGTDTHDPSGKITFVGWKDGKTFVLRYGLYRPQDPLCCPTGGTSDVIYQWSDAERKIVTVGEIPPTTPSDSRPLSRR